MNTAPTNILNQAPDPATRTASKQIFQLIQAIHHKHTTDNSLATNTFPPGMMRQVTRLTDFIKPATPSDTTRHKIQNNTDNWMRTNMAILQEHYTNTIHTLGHIPHNPIAFQIATGWARKRYGQRLRADTITATEGILSKHMQHHNTNNNNKPSLNPKSRLVGSLSTIPELSDEEEFPPLPVIISKLTPAFQPYPIRQSRTPLLPTPTQRQTTLDGLQPQPQRLRHDRPYQTNRQNTFPLPQTRPPLQTTLPDHPIPKPRRKTLNGLPTHPVYNKGPLQAQRAPGQLTSRQTPPDPNTSTPPSVRGKKLVSWGPGPVSQEAEIIIKPNPKLSPILPTATRRKTLTTRLPPSSSTPDSPTISTGTELRRRTQQTEAQIHQVPDTQNNTLELQSITLNTHSYSNVSTINHDTISSPPSTPTGVADPPIGIMEQRGAPETITGGSPNMMSGQLKANTAIDTVSETSLPLLLGSPPPTCAARGSSTPSPPDDSPAGPSSTSSPFSLPPNTPSSGNFHPTSHIARHTRKLQDWSFKSRRPVLVLGDSNINRIPPHNNPDIQLDSYPGANMYHFLKICEKTVPNPAIKIVVLSIGINNKDQDPRQTSCKQLKSLHKQAQLAFPNADIYFPIINFSDNLSTKQQYNLKYINNTIATYFPFLAEIPHDTFLTEKDNIHWKPATAQLIFNYWLKQLNLQ